MAIPSYSKAFDTFWAISVEPFRFTCWSFEAILASFLREMFDRRPLRRFLNNKIVRWNEALKNQSKVELLFPLYIWPDTPRILFSFCSMFSPWEAYVQIIVCFSTKTKLPYLNVTYFIDLKIGTWPIILGKEI